MFNIGDDSTWATVDFNDSGWYPVTVPDSWENQGFANYDGVAWYRTNFSVDSNYFVHDTLYLHIGKVRDTEQTYINGYFLGDTDQNSDSTEILYHAIPTSLIRQNNLLAIRIYNQSRNGGILSGPVKISVTPPEPSLMKKGSAPHRSTYQLPFSNGIAVATYQVTKREFSDFRPHLYTKIDKNSLTPTVATSARTVLFHNRREIPLADLPTVSAGYIEGTGIIHHKIHGQEFTLDQYAFSPFSKDKAFWIFYAVLKGDSLENFSLNFEITDKDPNLHVGKWSFQDKNRKWLFVICYYNEIPNPKSYTVVRKYRNEHPGFTALIKEIDWWKKWHKTTILPPNISKEEASVYSQSVAVLKMAQCRERFPARGQIVNSFPPQKSTVSDPISMGFAIDAFLNSGHCDEALSALQFIINGRCGSYKHFQWAGENIGVGQNYCISTDHYFGNGLEANSAGEFGPRLYLGNFGVVLWNLKQYVEITNDIKFLEYYWPKISTEIADVIINSIDNTGLIRADNGFFNRGAPKHYTFTSVTAYRGLVDTAWLARMVNDDLKAIEYENAAIALRQQIEMNLYDDEYNVLQAFMESKDMALDAVNTLALIWVFTPQDFISKGTLSVFEKNLSLNHGFRRYISPINQHQHEWVFGDILLSILNKRMTNFDKAGALHMWITRQAFVNFGLIPEYFDYLNSDYTGNIPQCGLGAGIYVSSYWGE